MSTKSISYCDVCHTEIKAGATNDKGEIWHGHVKYRIYTPEHGAQGDKIDLCVDHAEQVYKFLKSLR